MSKASQKGGRYIGKGVYGCSFSPAPKCESGKSYKSGDGTPTLGKIVWEDVSEEFEISKTVMRLHDAAKFFAAPTRSCDPALPISDTEAAKCTLKRKMGDPVMLIMPFAGEALVNWAQRLPRLASHLLPMMRHLLKGVQLYQTADIVHNDIHMGNIVVDKEGVARLIDFGMAFKRGSVTGFDSANHNRSFSPNLIWHPPEVQAMRIALEGLDMRESVVEMEEENNDLMTIGALFAGRASGTLLAAMTRFSADQLARSTSYGSFVRTYGLKFDCWRIGLCFWFMWNDLLKWPGLHFMPLWHHREMVRKVISGLTDFDPRTRLTIEDALALL